MGFRDYDPGLNRFLTRDMFNGALADMSLTTNPWTLSRYTFAGGNPTTRVEYDGHMPVIDSGGSGGGGPEEVEVAHETVLPNGTELIVLSNGLAFIMGIQFRGKGQIQLLWRSG